MFLVGNELVRFPEQDTWAYQRGIGDRFCPNVSDKAVDKSQSERALRQDREMSQNRGSMELIMKDDGIVIDKFDRYMPEILLCKILITEMIDLNFNLDTPY